MNDDLRADLIQHFLATAQAAARRRDWAEVLDLIEDVLVLDSDNQDALTLRLVAERHIGRGLPTWDRRQETVLFADLVGSTPLSNRFDPEFTRRLIRAYELACTPVLTALGGHVHRFVGDGILASFGYPTSHEDDARRAAHAALDLVKSVATTSASYASTGAELRVRVGIASGVLVHGDRGSGTWNQQGDLFGPAVNLAARLHEVAQPGEICISRETAELISGFFELDPMGRRELKGFDDPIDVYRVVRRTGATSWVDRVVTPPSPFIGRLDELAALRGRWDAAQGGTPAAVLVTGDPGVGKSRLLRELLDTTSDATRHVVELHCSAYRTASPLYPVRAAIERYCSIAPSDDDAVRLDKLQSGVAVAGLDPDIVPYLAVLLELDAAFERPELTPLQLREVTLAHLHTWISTLADRSSCLFVMEDIHWADPSTRDLLQRVVASPPARLLTVVTSRRVPEWARSAGIDAIELEALGPEETRAMASAASADRLPPHVVDEIARRSDGIPLFVEQLVDSVSRSEAMATRTELIPANLTELLQARLDAAGSSKRVAQIAATMGREFEPELVEEVIQYLQDEGKLDELDRPVRDHLDRLVESRLLEPDRGEGRRLRFRHALVGEAAYESQLIEERPDRHEALARLLLAGGTTGRPADPAVVGRHFEQANLSIEAISQYLEAATRGQALGAYAEVMAHLDRAERLVGTLEEPARPPFELAVRLQRGSAVMATGGYAAPGVVDDFDRAVVLCEDLHDTEGMGTEVLKALLGLWCYYYASGDLGGAEAVSASMERQVAVAKLPAGRPSFHACRGVELFCRGELADSTRHFSQAIELIADDDVDPAHWPLPNDPLAAVYAFMSPMRLFMGDEQGARGAAAAGLERCVGLEFPRGPFSVAFVHTYEAWMHRERGALDDAVAAAEEVVRLGDQHGFLDWLMAGRMQLAAAHIAEQPSADVLGDLGESIATWHASNPEWLLSSLMMERARGYICLGDLDRAAECLADADEIIGHGQRTSLAEAHRLKAELIALTAGPDDPRVRIELVDGMRFAAGHGAHLFVLRCGETFGRWLGLDALDGDLSLALDRARAAFGPASTTADYVRRSCGEAGVVNRVVG
jgi:class 3 adenylate cyclase